MRVIVRSAGGLLCALASCLVLNVSFAPAAVTHEYLVEPSKKLSEGVPAEGPKGEPIPLPGQFEFVQSMAVDSGELYVSEGQNETSRNDKFGAATGAFIEQFPQISSPKFMHQSLTVGHSIGETQVYIGGDVYPEGSPLGAVGVLSPSGSLESTWTGADTPSKGFGCFECFARGSIAVDSSPPSLTDWAAGDVYVVDVVNKVVDVFKPVAGGGEEYVTQLTGPEAPGTLFSEPISVAVEPSNGEVVVVDSQNQGQETVYLFKPAPLTGQYELLGTLAGPPPGGTFGPVAHMAIDAGNGDIYVVEEGSNVIDEFNAEGQYVGRLTGTPTGPSGVERPFVSVQSIAIDPASHDVYVADIRSSLGEPTVIDAFGPDIVSPDVTTGAATAQKASGEGRIEATLNGTVNPLGEGEASCRFVWGTTKEFGQIVPCEPENVAEASSPVPVRAKLVLAPDTTYDYRLQATNKNGTNPGEPWQDVEFTTEGPGLRGASTSNVRNESATFDAKIDPHGKPTTYYFQYGTSAAYGTDAPALSEEAARGAAAGSGEGAVEVAQHVVGLSTATLYHYRVVAVSELAPGELETFYGPDQTFTTQRIGLPFQLPDGRAWEMVSPSQKEGALLFSIGGGEIAIQASVDGNAFTDVASAPTEAEPVGGDGYPSVFFGRGSGSWSPTNITPPHVARTELNAAEYPFFSENLVQGVLEPAEGTAPLSPQASEATGYLRTNYLSGNAGAPCREGCYQPLVDPANVPPGTKFGQECRGTPCHGPSFIGASPDLRHVVLSSNVDLTSTSAEGESGMYEWSDGGLALINLLPAGETNRHGGPVAGQAELGVNGIGSNDIRHAISDDGSRIVWTYGQGLYSRDMTNGETETTRLDVVQGGEKGSEGVLYQTASSDGSRIFFLDQGQLTPDSTARSGRADLYEYDFNAPLGSRLTDLSVDLSGPANVASVIGASEDGSYVYFAAAGALVPGAHAGTCGFIPPPGDTEPCNLYMRHNGATILVAALSPDDYPAWSRAVRDLPARVSPDGQWLVFMSDANLTGYDSTDAANHHADEEVYLYNATSGKLVCPGCNPTGARPLGAEDTEEGITGLGGFRARFANSEGVTIASNVPVWTNKYYQSRYLFSSGRLFFDSSDALSPQDVNGTEDVYEYEPAGVGGCDTTQPTFSERSGGCVSLISSGTSKDESGFLDASEGGGSVFFLTTSKLLGQDINDERDIYVARECSTASPCIPQAQAEPPPCDTAAACKPPPSPQPTIFGSPSSATFAGAGNVIPSKPQVVKQVGPRRAQRLARALKACHRKKPKKKRVACERQTRKHYAANKARNANATKKGRG